MAIASPAGDVMARVAARYEFRGDAVERFLQHHPKVGPVLIEAADVIPAYFGEGTPVALEVLHDPEADGEPELYALIRSTLSPEDALARLRQLDRAWWLKALPRAGYRLTLSLELA